MTNIKLKAVSVDSIFITNGQVYTVTRIDYDGDYVIEDNDGDEYYVTPGNKDWEVVKEFSKCDLCNGDIVLMRNGCKYVFMKDVAGREDAFVRLELAGKERLSNYKDNLLHNTSNNWDVMEVYRCTFVGSWSLWDSLTDYECVFKREDRKKMTVEQIEAALGYKIEVIDNE